MSNELGRYLTLVIGTLITVEFFVRVPVLNSLASSVLNWMPLVTSFAVVIGGINMIAIHKDNIARKKSGWYNSALLIGFLLITVFIGLTQGTSSQNYAFLYYQILIVCGNSLSGLLAFFIASSSFRAFRAKNAEAACLLFAGAIVMLGQAPFGALVWSGFPTVADWIMKYPNLAAQRGLMIASGLGFMSVSLRLILGYSRGRFGSD